MKRRTTLFVAALIVLLVSVFTLSACGNTDGPNSGEGKYTYNSSMASFPTNWNPHVYQTNTDATVMDYTAVGFYGFDYNDAKDGYKLVPQLAKEFPIDVTEDFVGQYGIKEGETGKAYKIVLDERACFDNGDPITANDFVESLRRLLNPVAQNYRADSVYQGNLVLYNAKNYLYQGQTGVYSSRDVYDTYSEANDAKLIFGFGPYVTDAGTEEEKAIDNNFRKAFGFVDAGYGLEDTQAYMAAMLGFELATIEAMEGKTLAEIKADETLKGVWEAIIGWWKTTPDEELDFFYAEKTWAEVDFNDVGIDQDEDGNLYIFLEKSLSGFYLHYSLTSTWLVHIPTYDACESVKDGVYTNTYGTKAELYVGYGPYKLTSFMKDTVITFERNDDWFLMTDDTYMTTNVNIRYVEKDETRLQLFKSGELDIYGLTANDMDEYQSSKYTYMTEGDSTWFLAFNPDMDGLKAAEDLANAGSTSSSKFNKTIITIKEFRQAFCFALDRAAFALAVDPLGGVAKALYGNIIVSNPETGEAYRTTDEAKQAIVSFWGLADEIGEGKTYATIDEAIASITGYDPAAAKELFNAAYDKAIAQGLMDEDDVVKITIGIPASGAAYYSQGAEFLKNTFIEAAKGTKLEGKITFENSNDLGNGFADALRANTVDMLFGVGWTGSALDPYGLISAYTDAEYQYDPAWDTSKEMLTIELDGKKYSASVWAWTEALAGEEITLKEVKEDGTVGESVVFSAGTNADMNVRLKVLAAIEQIVLEQYNMIPMLLDNSAALKGMQIKYYTEEYIFGVGRGGVKYMTYYMDDAEWKEYVKSQGGSLNYAVSE